jgi:hypothetical protein
MLRYRYSRRPRFPSDTPADDNALAAILESSSDFNYLGADLVNSPDLPPVASRIIVAYGKSDLPEFPDVSYNQSTHMYQYAFAARPVSFADGHATLVSAVELPTLFREHNAARATLHLPPQSLDSVQDPLSSRH